MQGSTRLHLPRLCVQQRGKAAGRLKTKEKSAEGGSRACRSPSVESPRARREADDDGLLGSTSPDSGARVATSLPACAVAQAARTRGAHCHLH